MRKGDVDNRAYRPAQIRCNLLLFAKYVLAIEVVPISGFSLAPKTCDQLAARLAWAAKRQVPILVPGLRDGAFGSQLWQFYQTHKDFTLDVLAEEHLLSDIVFEARTSGALMVGGGISKHHTIWWNQFRGGLDYAIQLTTAPEWDGSLSGARIREAVSWGKVRPQARRITVEGDASVLLPLLAAVLL